MRLKSLTYWVGALSTVLAGCRSRPSDPAPPAASHDIAMAPPGARGARAAGTDAAPPPPGDGDLGTTDGESTEPPSEGAPPALGNPGNLDAGTQPGDANADAGGVAL